MRGALRFLTGGALGVALGLLLALLLTPAGGARPRTGVRPRARGKEQKRERALAR